MDAIYQEIWNADQTENGIQPLLDTEEGSLERGFVKVNSTLDNSTDPDLKVLTEVHIPDQKMATYNACRKLFNNYTLAEPMPESDTAEERQEVHDFVNSIIDTAPMIVAREYIQRESGTNISRERWYNTIVEMWFRRFSSGGDPALSGFEHVIVGEQEKSKIQGYHFWWKYYLDDTIAQLVDDSSPVPAGLSDDRITYHGSLQAEGQNLFPESVTISFRWQAPDYDAMAVRPLFKKIGGFFVGCSVEGLMALGTVRAHLGARAPKTAVIEGASYDMKVYRSSNGQQIRTFYPIFRGVADPVNNHPVEPSNPVDPPSSPVTSFVRLVGAKINPAGHDPGFETITLANVSNSVLLLDGWSLADKNNRTHSLSGNRLESGEFKTITLSGTDIQLSNKGGEISLRDQTGTQMQKVSYSGSQAIAEGITLLF